MPTRLTFALVVLCAFGCNSGSRSISPTDPGGGQPTRKLTIAAEIRHAFVGNVIDEVALLFDGVEKVRYNRDQGTVPTVEFSIEVPNPSSGRHTLEIRMIRHRAVGRSNIYFGAYAINLTDGNGPPIQSFAGAFSPQSLQPGQSLTFSFNL